MKYTITCPICQKTSLNKFTINVNPTIDGTYDVTCPINHEFKINIPTYHFQTLFENGLNALADQYNIEAISSFASSYERFMEFFIRIVIKSRGIKQEEFDSTWKLISKQSERQLGAFTFIYLKEFGTTPKLLKDSNIKLRNNVIHKGYFPTMEECIKYGDDVLETIRPIIKQLKDDTTYIDELLKSVHSSSVKEYSEIRMIYLPYSLFAINRSTSKIDEKLVADFLIDRYEEKNDKIYEETLKNLRSLIKEKNKPPKPNKYIINHEITKIVLKELYNFRYFNSGESDINLLMTSYNWKNDDVEKIINHLEIIDWIRKYNINGKYTLTGIGSMECEKRELIELKIAEKHITERIALLKYLLENKSQKINYNYSHLDLANDFNKKINEIGVFIADIKEKGYVTHYYRITKEGEEYISNLKK